MNNIKADIKKYMPIVQDELNKSNIFLYDIDLLKFTEDVISISYSKGGDGDEKCIRAYTHGFIQIKNTSVVQKELLQKNIKMDEHDIWFLTGEIIKILHNNNRGASEEEIKDMTKQCINNGLYKKFIGYSKKLDNRVMPIKNNE